jgi:hypothetical protein
MAIGIFGLLEVMLIFINAIAILNEDRFLAKSTPSHLISSSQSSLAGTFTSYQCNLSTTILIPPIILRLQSLTHPLSLLPLVFFFSNIHSRLGTPGRRPIRPRIHQGQTRQLDLRRQDINEK